MEIVDLQISGSELSEKELETLQRYAHETANKLHPIHGGGQDGMHINVKTYNKEGTRKKYAIEVRFKTPKSVYNAKSDDWDLALTISECMKKLERIVIKDHEKELTKRKVDKD